MLGLDLQVGEHLHGGLQRLNALERLLVGGASPLLLAVHRGAVPLEGGRQADRPADGNRPGAAD